MTKCDSCRCPTENRDNLVLEGKKYDLCNLCRVLYKRMLTAHGWARIFKEIENEDAVRNT